jgi:hypothetical protein
MSNIQRKEYFQSVTVPAWDSYLSPVLYLVHSDLTYV